MKQLYPSGLVESARATIKLGSLWKTIGTLLVLLIFLHQDALAQTLVAELVDADAKTWESSGLLSEDDKGVTDEFENTGESLRLGEPRMTSAVKDSETQITITFDSNVATNGTNPTDFTVVDGFGTPFIVSAQADGTAGDKDIILTVADLSTAQGDLKITYKNNNNEIRSAETSNLFVNTDNNGVTLDGDSTAPTLVSATKDSDTQITLTFSEAVKTNGGNPTDFTVKDAADVAFNVTAQVDGTALDNQIVLTTDDLSTAQLSLTITYTNNNNEIADFGSNSLATDATGVNMGIFTLSDVTGPFYWEYQGGGPSLPAGPNPAALDTATLPLVPQRFGGVAFGDLDGDGDVDFVSGSNRGTLFFYRNEGTPTNPAWVRRSGVIATLDSIKIGKLQNTNEVSPTLHDFDGDGDLDLIVGTRWNYEGLNKWEDVYVFINGGTPTNPVFDPVITDNRFGIGVNTDIAFFRELPAPSFVDLDGDNDFDMFLSGSDSSSYFKNVGTATAPFYEWQAGAANPLAIEARGGTFTETSWLVAIPQFADFDNDGDFDLYFADEVGFVRVMENTGTATNPVFAASKELGEPFKSTDHGAFGKLDFADVNNDGIIDIMTTHWNPTEWFWYAGRTTVVNPILTSVTKGSDTQITASFDQNVQTNGGNPTDFTVVDGQGTSYVVSAQADGTAGDTDIVLTVANLASAVGDLTVTYTNNNNEISDAASGINFASNGSKNIDLDTMSPTLVSASKDTETQITVTLSESVQTNGGNPTDFTVVDGVGTNFAVSAQADGTANDANIVLTVADLSVAAGDLKVTYANNNGEISDFGGNSLATDATGLTIDTDVTAPTLTSGTKVSNTQITITFSESVQTKGTNPTDFTVVDGIGTGFAVSVQADGTAKDTEIVLTVADLTAAVGDLKLTYTNSNNEISDFGSNNLATDGTGVSVEADAAAPTLMSAVKASDTELTLTFNEPVFFDGTGVSAGFTVVDGLGTSYTVSAIADGTTNDTDLTLTVATLTAAVGDLKVTFDAGVPENRIFDFGGNSFATNATGATIDTDTTAPTLVSGVKDTDTQLTITLSEPIQILGDTPDDWTVKDANNTPFAVSQVTDGTAQDDKLILTVADLSTATGPLTVTFSEDCAVIADFGNNALQTDATGIDIALVPTISGVSVPSDRTRGIGERLEFTVTFSDPVTISGAPTLPITIGSTAVNATLDAPVTASTTAFFSYTILEGQEDTDGIVLGASLDLNGATIQNAANVDAILTLNGVGATTAVLVDGIVPSAPVILSITDDTGTSDSDQNTNDQTLVVKGTAEANSRLSILVDGVGPFGGITLTVDGDGNWEFNPVGEGTFTLEEGVHTYTATVEDAAGNVSAVSENFVVTVDLTAPAQPTIDLTASADLGISDTDNLTSGGFIELNGTAEPNTVVVIVALDENGVPNVAENEGDDEGEQARAVVDESGNWVYSLVFPAPSSVLELVAIATDAAGNSSVQSETLTIVYDQETALVSTSPAHQEEDVLPNTNLTITFDENVVKGTGNITIVQSDNDEVQQTIDVTGDNVTVDGTTVTIDPPANILPSDTEFYVNIDEGTFENEAGAPFGISDKTTWTFRTIAASVVSSVSVPSDATYKVGQELDFVLSMVLPVTVTGTPTIPLTIGDQTVNATLVGTATATSTLTFRYTIVEGDLDTDGIAVGSAMNLNGGTMKDEFDVDAILALNSVGATTAVLVDGVTPVAPLILSITDDTGTSDSDQNTKDQSLVVKGTAEANSTLSLLVDGVGPFGGITLTVDGDGNWEFDPVGEGTFTLEEGVHTYTATVEDAAGNVSAVSENFVVTVDLTAPAQPTIDLTASADLGISDTDNLTSGGFIELNGTAEPNTVVVIVALDENGVPNVAENEGDDEGEQARAVVDESGNWVYSLVFPVPSSVLELVAIATDAAGNSSVQSETLTIVYDQETALLSTSPAHQEEDVLPNTNLTITFDENVVKGTGNITIVQSDNDEIQQTIDVTGDNVTVYGTTVTIDPAANILPPDTEFYVNIDEGAFENEAGAPFGISDKTTWTFRIIAASVVTDVAVSADGTYMIGDNLDFTVSMVLPVSVTGGTPSIPVTIGTETVNATLVGTATNTATMVFRYTVAEGLEDLDGIAVGTAMDLNGGTMKDEFEVDAILTLNSVASTANVLVDAIKPAAPVVVSITNDSGTATDDEITNDNTLTFIGTAEANATVSVSIDGTGIGSTTADGSGDWTYDHSGTTLADATYSVTATATDAAGNEGPASAALEVVVDTTPPAQPTIDLAASADLGISNTDNLTSGGLIELNGTAEPNSVIVIRSLDENGNPVIPEDQADETIVIVDESGNWTFSQVGPVPSITLDLVVMATDAAGNTGVQSEKLSIVYDQDTELISTSPSDDEIDVLPNANLTLTFDENVVKGTGNITIIQSDNDQIQQTIDVTGPNVTINGAVVTIDPPANILPPDTEFYVNIDAGAFENEAGAPFGINSKTTWSFNIIAASVVTSLAVPADGTYNIGDNLDFTVNMVLPVTASSTTTLPVTIGSSTVNATLVGTAANTSTMVFRYTVVEDELDADGIAVGAAMNLNGGTMQDEFGVDAILTLNGVASTAAVLVDGVKPTPTITSTAVDLVKGTFSATITYDEAVEGVAVSDLTVSNGTASNLMNTVAGTTWTVDISPTADGAVSVSLAPNTAKDLAGNDSKASNTISRNFDGTAPTVLSVNRKDSDPLNTATTEAGFRITFSEAVTGVDIGDVEVVLTGSATGLLNGLTAIDATTYDVSVSGIGGEGTIGLNVKDDDSIIDAATNPLAAAFTGQVYTTNFVPTDIALSTTNTDENNGLTATLATIATTDADPTDSHTYTLVAGTGDTDNGSFAIEGSNLNANGLSFNFEDKASYELRLMTDDGKGGKSEKAFTLTINDLNEVPMMLSLSNSVIDESDQAQDIGTLVALDQDGGETFSYSLVAGTGDTDNAQFEINGTTLRTAGATNFEDGATRSILVRVTDSGGLTLDQQFTITINNVVEETVRPYTQDAPGADVKNVFSPNGDGVNETWIIEDLLDNPVNEVKVYAQGGKLIFSQTNYQNDWGGTFNGNAIPDGTYYYEITVFASSQDSTPARVIRGFLTIIRSR